jgi:hypothetical protein
MGESVAAFARLALLFFGARENLPTPACQK